MTETENINQNQETGGQSDRFSVAQVQPDINTLGGQLLSERQPAHFFRTSQPEQENLFFLALTTSSGNQRNESLPSLAIPTDLTVAELPGGGAGRRRETRDSTSTGTPEQRYQAARGAFDRQLSQYWQNMLARRQTGGFVNEFPPVYDGPTKPRGMQERQEPRTLPHVNDMLGRNRDLMRIITGDQSRPDYRIREVSEDQFKQSYAREALMIGQQNGLSHAEVRNIMHRIFAFESGGHGTREMLSGVPRELLRDDNPGETTVQEQRRNTRPASTAIGYTQMLQFNTVRHFDTNATIMSDRLRQLASENPDRASELTQKADLVNQLHQATRRNLLAFAEANRNGPAEQRKNYLNTNGEPNSTLMYDFAKSDVPLPNSTVTGRQFASALHAFHIDGDLGPILQSMELRHLVQFAQSNNFAGLLAQRQQLFNQNVTAYDNLSGNQKTETVREIMSRIEPPSGMNATDRQQFLATRESLTRRLTAMAPGSNIQLASQGLSEAENEMLNTRVMQLKSQTERGGQLSASARLLMDKIFVARFGEMTADRMMPAAIELANLAGEGSALRMLQANNRNLPTANFFDRAGYEANPVTHGRTGDELLLQIHRNMHGPNSDPTKRPRVDSLLRAFDSVPQTR